ncbi:ribbon-helix-helix domain-containing protein [Bradyrhizobium sp. BR13661]|jgi:predicted DNA-binding ribbon-helix-helix protein|uniref:ribbon-helix-helix domain-containing protein n=1 Tax=Bradyrhizobium sp. BR13661 TaxID=2940622 RepID=UPI002473F9C5|nr:ribbon-helix-helix domain-containing protein [Bradyrhizobium sp. BR13661]MDH6263367.1 putative DNA-binding ribbon-helix-helix protein [Bradyrhizobium sp. BR13661]
MSQVAKRSIVVRNHRSSVSLEIEFWSSLREIAKTLGVSTQELVAEIDRQREHANLSCAIRLFVLDYYRSRIRKPLPPAVAAPSSDGGDQNLSLNLSLEQQVRS